MKLTVVGCSGSFPGPESPASCYLLETEGPDGAGGLRTWRILLDLGSGALGALQRFCDPLSIDAVFLSHLHADHCLDLCGYYVMRTYHPTGVRPRVPVWGPVGVASRMARAYDLADDPGMRGVFDFGEYAGPVQVGPFTVEPAEVCHPVAAYAFRVSADGASIVYTGDTAPCESLEELAAGTDLLLAEAAFRDADDNPDGIHLTGGECGQLATAAGAARLVLTHIAPWHEPEVAASEARQTFDGPIELAHPGATYTLG